MCSGSQEFDLPLVDLSLLPCYLEGKSQDLKTPNELQKLGEACEDLGFFRVINHGIDPTLIKTMDSVARDMFTLPTEGSWVPLHSRTFRTSYGPKETIFSVPAYHCKMTELAHRLTKLIIQSLGLDVSECYTSASFDKCQRWLLLNFYHTDDDDALRDKPIVASSKVHTDIRFLTILYEDQVGRLEIGTKEGKWINAKPVPDSFIVNIGDCLKRSAPCGVRRDEELTPLLAHAHDVFCCPLNLGNNEIQICSPPELIDEQHPRLYKPVTFEDIKSYYRRYGPTLEGTPTYYMN
eukprot:Gb_30549 [translate_table: standard]